MATKTKAKKSAAKKVVGKTAAKQAPAAAQMSIADRVCLVVIKQPDIGLDACCAAAGVAEKSKQYCFYIWNDARRVMKLILAGAKPGEQP